MTNKLQKAKNSATKENHIKQAKIILKQCTYMNGILENFNLNDYK